MIEYSSRLAADRLVAAINRIQDAIRAAAPTATVIHPEPDVLVEDRPDAVDVTPERL